MGEGLLELFDSRGMRRMVSHLDRRRKLYLGVFAIGFVAGYPMAEVIIEWLLESDGYIPEGVEVIILQPLEVIFLQLRIAVQIAFVLTIATIILDLPWTGCRRCSDAAARFSIYAGALSAVKAMLTRCALGLMGLALSLINNRRRR